MPFCSGKWAAIIVALSSVFLTANASSCLDGAEVDIVFVLDSSGSVTQAGFDLLLTFVKNMVQNFNIGSNAIRVGVEKFSGAANTEFDLNSHYDKNSMVSEIQRIVFTGGGTNTGDALDYLKDNMFTSANGDRPGVLNIGVVITDGKSNDATETARAARECRSAGITMFAIGVGNGIPTSELNEIATDPDYNHVLKATGYSDLSNIKSSFETVACKAGYLQGQQDMERGAFLSTQRNCTDFNRYLSDCSYTCDVGYQLRGSPDAQCTAVKRWSAQQTCPEACSWVKHHCWPGDCSGNYASNCVCRPGFTRRQGTAAELCDPDTPPDLSLCHMSVTDANGDVYNASYPGNDTECGTQEETWIQADPVELHFTIQADWNLTVGSFVDYVSQSEVGIVGMMVSMIHVNVSGDEVLVQNETLDGWPFCQQNVTSTNPLNNGTSFVCQGILPIPQQNLTGDCFDGWYTRRCDEKCLNCDVTGSCVRDTGVCDFGCKPGWLVGNFTSFCNTTCPEYTFGKDCKVQCGNCWNSTSCRHDIGTCEEGCAEDYGGARCERWIGTVLTLQITAGTLFGLALLAALLLLMLMIYRKKFGKRREEISPSS
ncbi:hypothetical protein BaRGS_00006969, partial [Batillaria attramentaria]